MKVTHLYLALILTMLFFQSCVSKRKYTELETLNRYYQTEAKVGDSLRYVTQVMNETYRDNEGLLRKTIQELNDVTTQFEGLSTAYDTLVNKYNKLIDQNNTVLATASQENVDLQDQLSAQQEELDDRTREKAIAEYEARNRANQISILQGTYSNIEGDIAARDRRIAELESMMANNRTTVQDLRTSVKEAMSGFTPADLQVEGKDGKLYVSLSQNLLFKSGSDVLDWQGKKAIQQLADVLNQNGDIDILVEGHTDSDGTAEQNWDLSVKRATAVVKSLTAYGVDPRRITAAGRSFYAPIDNNNTAAGKARNRRTDIILSPQLDQLYQVMNR